MAGALVFKDYDPRISQLGGKCLAKGRFQQHRPDIRYAEATPKGPKNTVKVREQSSAEASRGRRRVGLYVFHVIVEAFSGLAPKPKELRRPAIDLAWKLPAAALAHEARVVEPHAVLYLGDALTEVDDVVLTAEEQTHCARVVQAAILCLHEACENRP